MKVLHLVLGGSLLASLAMADNGAIAKLEAVTGEALVPRLSIGQLLEAPENKALKKFVLETKASSQLSGKKIAVLSTDGVEEMEVTVPIQYLKAQGATVHLVSPRVGKLPAKYGVQYPMQRATHILTVRFMENATWLKIDRFLDQVKATDYDAILIPGGAWNPDSLRQIPEALQFVKEFDRLGKPIAALCHGPLVLASAGILKNRTATAYWNVQGDVKNAGATVLDQEVVIDGNLITSRFPFDLPAFLTSLTTLLKK